MIDGIHLTRATVVGREKPVTAKGDVRTITTELVIAVPAFGDWLFNVDRAATEAAYAHIPHGDAVRCGCAYCRNFIAVRDAALPADFQQFLRDLGIDPAKEAEVYHEGRQAPGSHYYGGWFHFVGSLERTGDFAPVTFSGGLISYMCKPSAPNLPTFDDLPLVQLEFRASNVPWGLPDPELD